MGLSFAYSFLMPPHLYPFIVEVLFHLYPLSTSSTGSKSHSHGYFLYPSLTSLRHSSLQPAPCACVFRRSYDCAPPLCHPWSAPRSLSSPGGVARHRSFRASMSLPLLPLVLLRILALSGFGVHVGWIFVKRREAKAPPLPSSHAPWSLPPAT